MFKSRAEITEPRLAGDEITPRDMILGGFNKHRNVTGIDLGLCGRDDWEVLLFKRFGQGTEDSLRENYRKRQTVISVCVCV